MSKKDDKNTPKIKNLKGYDTILSKIVQTVSAQLSIKDIAGRLPQRWSGREEYWKSGQR